MLYVLSLLLALIVWKSITPFTELVVSSPVLKGIIADTRGDRCCSSGNIICLVFVVETVVGFDDGRGLVSYYRSLVGLWVAGRGEDLAGEADARSGTGEAIKAIDLATQAATDCEGDAEAFEVVIGVLRETRQISYHRFNCGNGLRGIKLDQYQKLGLIQDMTNNYLEGGDTESKIQKCVLALAGYCNEPTSSEED